MTGLEVSIEDHIACQLSSWYPEFSGSFPNRRKGLTMQSHVLDVPDSFLPYLTEDGVRLPPNTKPSSCLGCKARNGGIGSDHDDDSWSADSSEDEQDVRVAFDQSLNALTEKISLAINELGGFVMPKLNWSSPKDASWMNEGTLKCSTAGDVYLLLKSSDFVSSDLELIGALKSQKIQLILRKWANLYPSHEFRCFVKNHRLVGVSQRHADQHFESLQNDKDDLLGVLEEFLGDYVVQQFASGKMPNFVVDVYVDRSERVWIVDFNVWGARTDSLLFEWDELKGWGDDKENEIRVVKTEKQVKPHPLNHFRAPVDTVHLASITGGKPYSFKAFMDLCRTQEVDEEEQ